LIAILAVVPLMGTSDYFLHLGITSMLMAVSGTGWAMMGRFGLVSLGHGAFIGTAAYVMALLWNEAGLTPWLGLPIGVGAAMILAALLGYPCFRLRVVGHYFALVTLAAGEIVRLMIVALREHTGGSLGMTPRLAPDSPFSRHAVHQDRLLVDGADRLGLRARGLVDARPQHVLQGAGCDQ
jgi:branched-chain amino acid transport system permease protein